MFNKELKKRIHTVLKDKANYVSFAFGHKFTAGKNTKQFSILVFVSKKDANVAEKDRIPDTIEGYPTDVQLYSPASSLTVSPSYHCIQCNDLSVKTPITCMFTDQTTTTGPYNSAYTVPGLIHRSTFKCNIPGNNYNKPQVAGGMSGAPGGGCTITTIAQDTLTQELLILGNQHCLINAPGSDGFVTSSQLLSSYTGGIDGIVTSQDVTSFVSSIVFKQGEGSSPSIVGAFAKTNFQPYNIIGAISHLTCDELADLDPPVPCYKADVAAYTVLPNVIPMQGVLQIGDGPFEWMTEEDFCELYCGSPDCSDCAGNTVHVYKSGRTTGTQTPAEDFIVVSVDLELNVFKEFLSGTTAGRRYQATIGIQHREDANKPFGGGGDSGSPVLVEHNGKLKILGILTWGTPSPSQGIPDQSDAPTTTTPATIFIAPMWQVAEALQVKAWNYTQETGAGEIVVNSDEPTITVAGRTYVKGTQTSLPITHVKDN